MKKLKVRERCDHCKKFVTVDGQLYLLYDEADGKYGICEKCSNKHDKAYWLKWESNKKGEL